MKRITVKEEFVKITKGFTSAIIFDYLFECDERANKWFKIDLKQTLKETMLDISEATLRREIKKLIKKGLLLENNQGKKYQYKINEEKLKKEFEKLGIFIEEKEVEGNKKVRDNANHEQDSIKINKLYFNDITHFEGSQVEIDKISNYLKKQLEYQRFVEENKNIYDAKMFDKLYKIMLEVLTSKKETIRINKNEIYSEIVKSVFKKVDYSILESVIFKLKRLKNKVTNFKNYIITSIYNTYLEEDFQIQNNLYMDWRIV